MSLHYFAQYRLLISDDSSLLNLRNLADPHPRLMVAWIHILPSAWPLEESVCELVSVHICILPQPQLWSGMKQRKSFSRTLKIKLKPLKIQKLSHACGCTGHRFFFQVNESPRQEEVLCALIHCSPAIGGTFILLVSYACKRNPLKNIKTLEGVVGWKL
jgi:hypothetical protein